MKSWSCDFDIQQQEALQNLTVGRIFKLICKNTHELDQGGAGATENSQGEGSGVTNSFDKNQQTPQKPMEGFILKPEDKFKLKLIEVREKQELFVTSYLPGEHELKEVQLQYQNELMNITLPPFTIKSVINPQSPPEKPFGPYGPFFLHISPLYWIIIGGMFSFILCILGIKIKLQMNRRKLLRSLEKYNSALTPLNQFYKDIRLLNRKILTQRTEESLIEIVKELDKSFRLYLVRGFKIPALDYNLKKILKEIKKYHSQMDKVFSKEIKKLINEFARLEKSSKKILDEDCRQLIESTRSLVERLNKGATK